MKITLNQAVSHLVSTWKFPTVVMTVGVPGSGKSTFINALHNALIGYTFETASTDDMIDREAAKRGITYSEAFNKINFKTLKKEFNEVISGAILRGHSVVIDQTNMSKKSRTSKMKDFGDKYFKVCVIFDVDTPELQHRLAERAARTGKVIPQHVLFNMLNTYQRPSRDEGFDLIIDINNNVRKIID